VIFGINPDPIIPYIEQMEISCGFVTNLDLRLLNIRCKLGGIYQQILEDLIYPFSITENGWKTIGDNNLYPLFRFARGIPLIPIFQSEKIVSKAFYMTRRRIVISISRP